MSTGIRQNYLIIVLQPLLHTPKHCTGVVHHKNFLLGVLTVIADKLIHFTGRLFDIAGREISVGGYVDTVLRQHLEQHKEKINELYKKQREDLI